MNSFWKIALIILVNIFVSVSATLAVLYYWEYIRNEETPIELVTIDSYADSTTIPQSAPAVTETPVTGEEAVSTEGESIPAASDENEVPPVPAIRGSIVDVALISNPGDLENEVLRVISTGENVVNLQYWTLEDADGNILSFPNIQLLHKGIFVEVYSRPGHNTPYELYWNRDEAVWQSGETAVIKDQLGQVQATYRVP